MNTPPTAALELPGVTPPLGPTGPTAHLAPVEALEALVPLGRVTTAVRWAIGDLALDVIDWQIDDLHLLWQQVAGRIPDDRPAFMAAIAVSHAFKDRDRRRPELSWSHHRTVSITHRMEPDEADAWLDQAVEYAWSNHRLEQAIRAARDGTKQDPIPGTTPWHQKHRTAIQGVSRAFTGGAAAVVVYRDGTWEPVPDGQATVAIDTTGTEQ